MSPQLRDALLAVQMAAQAEMQNGCRNQHMNQMQVGNFSPGQMNYGASLMPGSTTADAAYKMALDLLRGDPASQQALTDR